MLRKEEDGFTLIEFIISMGVFSIVAVAITLFMQTGTNSYQNARSELDLQMESQMLINQIRDMAYSANYAEYDAPTATVDPSASPGTTADPMPRILTLYQIKEDYTYTPAPTGATVAPTSTPDPSASPGATVAPASESKQITTCEIVVWDPVEKELYYDKNIAPAGSDDDATVPAINLSDEDWRNKHLFSRYMENFSVDTDATGKIPNNTINLTLNMKAGKRKYELTEGITVRNKWVEYP